MEEIRLITAGRGVDVVYDSVGQTTFDGSLEALAKRGHLVNFGQSSGPIAPLDVSRLAAKSNALSRPMLFHYIESGEQLREAARSIFEAFSQGVLTAEAGTAFPLADAGAAHRALEARAATGPFILIPAT